MNIYCKHDWEIGDCGTDSDCWRECRRCNTMWYPKNVTREKFGTWGWFLGHSCTESYGKEPRTVVGTTGRGKK